MRTLAVVPIKTLSSAKQRLSGALATGARASLAQAMFSDVLASLRRSQQVEAIAVVTADVVANAVAHGERVTVLPDDRQDGQSAAALIGIRYAAAAGFERAVLVPGDTPLLDAVELDELLVRCEADPVAVGVVPDRHGTGTNALVLTPPGVLEPSFGPGSFNRHLNHAKGAGLTHRAEHVASLAHDVDTPEDLAALSDVLEGRRSIAPRTRGALRQLERSGVLVS
jgi:2-phospho-L-lactate/phosphoenolpyruvate guanylyltransferase